ncbi:hypothetical protein M8310_09160 [Enterobacter hormaechei]|nr:hypothetical protein [Enterobacter hormaechei]MBT1724612.1 hypothetical protein [Enterobacter hormaechei subsp. hoffmannii]MCL8113359.1 hypothetical protein [Enterobacter hormaechei]MCM8209491.1 hypothetical protein [Enterobacter hormaechei]OZP43408.1 hypothetical protein CIG28_10235 [Enterobacter hormaechei]
MSTLTKEWLLKTIAELEEERDAVPGAVNEDAAMALAAMKLALASLEAEAVGYMNRFTGRVFTLEEQPGADTDVNVYVPVYAAPPAQVSVPDEVSWEDVPEEITEDDMEVALAWAHGFNQCRAAMLQEISNEQ